MKTKITDILELFGDFVASHDYQETPILTAYVDIDSTNPANQRERPAWLIDLKNEAKRLEDEVGAEQLKRRSAQVKWTRAEEMILSYLQDRKPTGRTVVMFTDLEDDFVAVDLPVAMPTRLYYGIPQIKHLLFALDQYKKYLTILFSGAEVRLAEVFLTRTTGEVTVETEHEKMRRLSRKSMEAGQDRRSPEFERRFVHEMAAEIDRYFLDDPEFERLVFGGNAKLAHAVRSVLHPTVKELVVSIVPMDFRLPNDEIAQAVQGIASTFEEAHDLTIVEELVALRDRGGAGVLGWEETQNALQQGAAKTLILPYPIDAAQFDPLILDATLKGVSIEFVYGMAAEKLSGNGGIGARLYYTV